MASVAGNTEHYLAAAQRHLDVDQPDQARENLRLAMDLPSDDPRLLIAAAKLWRKLDETDQARQLFQSAIELVPESGAAWNEGYFTPVVVLRRTLEHTSSAQP